jgi:hypothetical protein
MILDHPLLTKIYGAGAGLASEFSLSQYRVPLSARTSDTHEYVDPLGGAPGGEAYNRDWIAASAPVMIRQDAARASSEPVSSGLVVFVQEDMASATTPVRDLGRELARKGLRALAVFLLVVALLWYFVFHVQGGRRWWRRAPFAPGSSIATPTPAHVRSTAAERGADARKS